MKKVLADHELSFVSTIEEAERVVERGRFVGILLGVQFDESRMFRLLERLRSVKRPPIPVVCVIGIKGRLSEAAVDACKKAASALGAEAILDLAHFPDDEQGNARLRGTILANMPARRSASVPQDF